MMRCVSCNACTKVCPQDLKVMDYVNAAIRGDLAKVADLSFDCIMCGLCAARCPGELVQYYIGLLARRLYVRGQVPRASHLQARLEELRSGQFDQPIAELMKKPLEELKALYLKRDIEPD
jgi:Na+-translocating ferredoxin:NAD+ oxidoreductase RnfC subunit